MKLIISNTTNVNDNIWEKKCLSGRPFHIIRDVGKCVNCLQYAQLETNYLADIGLIYLFINCSEVVSRWQYIFTHK